MQIPEDPQAITAEWLTWALRAGGTISKSAVTSVETQVIAGDRGCMGQMARLIPCYSEAEAGAPRSLIAKSPASNPEVRGACKLLRRYEREVRFYEQIAPHSPARTPRCYYSAIDPDSIAFILLLEDLAPARGGGWFEGCSVQEAQIAVAEIARLHAAWWQSPRLLEMDWLPQVAPTSMEWVRDRFRECWTRFYARLGARFPERLRATGERLGRHVEHLYAHLQGPPWTVVHYDYHPDNVFFGSPEGGVRFAVIDWQTALRARGVHDVSRFLGGSLSPDDRRAHEMGLLRCYHTTLGENGVEGYSYDACLYDYRLLMLDCLYRMVLSLGPERSSALSAWELGIANGVLPRYVAAVLDLESDELLPA
jgi:hypothetical protein